MRDRIRVGIVGYGYAGEVIHAPLIESVPDLELVAVSTSRADRAAVARERGLRVHNDPDALIAAADIDLVVIATPHDSHLPLALAAARSGKHVVVDKLMALDANEADAMALAARDAGVMLSVFHNRRWDGDFLAVRDLIARRDGHAAGDATAEGDPRPGALIRVRSWVHAAGPPSPDRWRSHRSRGGGIFSDWGAHLLDQALLLHRGPVARVYCTLQRAVEGVDVETAALCVIEFDSGVTHIVETNQLFHDAAKGYEIWGTDGRAVVTGFDPAENELNLRVRGVGRRAPGYDARWITDGGVSALPTPIAGDWAAYYRNIAAHLLDGDDLAVSVESVLRTMRLRDAALRSAAERRVIEKPV